MKTILWISLSVFFAAQSITPPVVTFVTDGNGGLRPMVGLAVSPSLGAPIDVGFSIGQTAIPPGHDFLVATTRQSNRPVLLQFHGFTSSARPLDALIGRRLSSQPACDANDTDLPANQRPSHCSGGSAAPAGSMSIDQIVMSSTGSAAALLSRATRRIYALGNLPQDPALQFTAEVGALGSLTAFGISDDGRTMAAGVSDGVTGALFLLDDRGAPRLVASMSHPSAIRFLRNSNDAIITDDADGKVYRLTGGQVITLATTRDGVTAPNDIAVANDNQKIFIGSSQSGSVTTIGPDGSVSAPVYCNCTLTGLRPTSSDSVFRLTDFSGGPVLLFDGGASVPRTIFVPVGLQY